MAIVWFKENDKNLISTIYDNNITLNKSCAVLLESAYSVMLGIDFENKIVLIKPLTKEIATRGDISEDNQYKVTVRSSYARISNIAFVNEIKKIIGNIELKNNPKKFSTSFDEKEKTLVIDLKGGVGNE